MVEATEKNQHCGVECCKVQEPDRRTTCTFLELSQTNTCHNSKSIREIRRGGSGPLGNRLSTDNQQSINIMTINYTNNIKYIDNNNKRI